MENTSQTGTVVKMGPVFKIMSTKVLQQGTIKKLVISWYYDLDGQIIEEPTEEKKFKNVGFKIIEEERKYIWAKKPSTELIVQIDGEDDIAWVDAYKYDKQSQRLLIRACSGAG